MSYSQYAGSIQAVRTRRVQRPAGVVVVAGFQAFKAAILVVAALLLHFRPGAVIDQRSVLYPILYVAMRGNAAVLNTAISGSAVLPAIILVFGIYLAYVAMGLWSLTPLARRSVMLTSGLTFLIYVKSALLSGDQAVTMSGMSFFSPSLHNVHILLFIDTAIFVYLMRGATAAYFKPSDSRSAG